MELDKTSASWNSAAAVDSLEQSPFISCRGQSSKNLFGFSRLEVQKNMFHFNGLCIFKQHFLY